MHIPNHVLNPAVCAVTWIAAVGTLLSAVRVSSKTSSENDTMLKFAAVTIAVFVGQLLNYPISPHTSGHLLGGVLAAVLLGIPLGMISIALVLAVQSIIFGDGGAHALGANIVNMAVIGAGLGGILFRIFKRQMPERVALVVASFCSVILAALACSIEIALSGRVTLLNAAKVVLPIHLLIALVETVITVILVDVISGLFSQRTQYGLTMISLLAILFTPLMSPLPDGLESTFSRLNLAIIPSSNALFQDYTIRWISHPYWSVVLAGLVGMMTVFICAKCFWKFLWRPKNSVV